MADINKLLNNIDDYINDAQLNKVEAAIDNKTMTEGINSSEISKRPKNDTADSDKCAKQLKELDKCVLTVRGDGLSEVSQLYEKCSNKMDAFWKCMHGDK